MSQDICVFASINGYHATERGSWGSGYNMMPQQRYAGDKDETYYNEIDRACQPKNELNL